MEYIVNFVCPKCKEDRLEERINDGYRVYALNTEYSIAFTTKDEDYPYNISGYFCYDCGEKIADDFDELFDFLEENNMLSSDRDPYLEGIMKRIEED